MDNLQTSLWRGEFKRLDFTFEGRKAVVVFPRDENRRAEWMLKTEYFNAFQNLEHALVMRGMPLAYLENRNRWGTADDLDAKPRFRDFLAREFGFSGRCVPIGMSCGGLHAIKLAARHPDTVSCLYLDAPVVNLLSCPFGLGMKSNIGPSAREEALNALGITLSDLLSYRDHPLDSLPALISSRIPACLVCGDADATVPYPENGALVRKAYEKTDIPFLFILKPGCDHHPHGPDDGDVSRVADFLIEHSR